MWWRFEQRDLAHQVQKKGSVSRLAVGLYSAAAFCQVRVETYQWGLASWVGAAITRLKRAPIRRKVHPPTSTEFQRGQYESFFTMHGCRPSTRAMIFAAAYMLRLACCCSLGQHRAVTTWSEHTFFGTPVNVLRHQQAHPPAPGWTSSRSPPSKNPKLLRSFCAG